MSEPAVAQPQGGAAGASSPGAMLRAAREKQGLHIAALAAAIKVAPRKLDALENDRWQDLPDATFARALAQTVCRTLKVDPRPILERLPLADTSLEHVGGSLNTPFDDAGGRAEGVFSGLPLRPLVLASAVLMLAALVLTFAPIPWDDDDEMATPQPVLLAPGAEPDAEPVTATEPGAAGPDAQTPGSAAGEGPAPAVAPPVEGTAPAAAVTAVPAVPVPSAAAADPPPAAASPAAVAGILRIRTTDASWIEVRDANERVLLSRLVESGETLGLDGAAPLRVVVGNAGATEVHFRGQPLDLAPQTRNNIARLTLR